MTSITTAPAATSVHQQSQVVHGLELPGVALWLDAGDAETIGVSTHDGNRMSSWTSKGPLKADGLKLTATQTVSGSQPEYVIDRIGRRAVRFNNNQPGILQFLDFGADYIFSGGTGADAGDGYTAIVVIRPSEQTGMKEKFVLDFGALGSEGIGLFVGEGRWGGYIAGGSGGPGVFSLTHASLGAGRISAVAMSIEFAPALGTAPYSLIIDGEVKQAGTHSLQALTSAEIQEASTRGPTSGPMCLGLSSKTYLESARGFTGDCYEVIVLRRKVSDDELRALTNTLREKWTSKRPDQYPGLVEWINTRRTKTIATDALATLSGTHALSTANYTITGTGSDYVSDGVTAGAWLRLEDSNSVQYVKVFSVTTTVITLSTQPTMKQVTTAYLTELKCTADSLGSLASTFDYRSDEARAPRFYSNRDYAGLEPSMVRFDGAAGGGDFRDAWFSDSAKANYNFLHDGTTGSTIMAVVRPKHSDRFCSIVNTGAGANSETGMVFGLDLRGTTTELEFRLWNSSGTSYANTKSHVIIDDEWMVVTCVYHPIVGADNGSSDIYLNGILLRSRDLSDDSFVPDSGDCFDTMEVGARELDNEHHAHMDVGEILVFNRPMAATELQTLTYYLANEWPIPEIFWHPDSPVSCSGIYDMSRESTVTWAASTVAPSGTIAVNVQASETVVTGVSTSFVTEAAVGDYIVITADEKTYTNEIAAIAITGLEITCVDKFPIGFPAGTSYTIGPLRVSKVKDQQTAISTTRKNLVQGTGAEMPLFGRNALKPGISGITSNVAGTAAIGVAATFDASQTNTIYTVWKLDGHSAAFSLFDGASGSGHSATYETPTAGVGQSLDAGTVIATGISCTRTPQVLGIRYAVSGCEVWVNGSQASVTLTSAGSESLDGLYLLSNNGGTSNAKATISECLTYTSDITDAHHEQISRHLCSKYSIPYQNSPLHVPGLVSWFDYSDPNAISLNAGNISNIQDKVRILDGEQAVGAAQPLWSSTGAVKKNGYLYGRHDTARYVEIPVSTDKYKFLHDATGSDVFIVVKIDASVTGSPRMFSTGTVNSTSIGVDFWYQHSDGRLRYKAYQATGVFALQLISADALTVGKWYIFRVKWKGTDDTQGEMWANGVEIDTAGGVSGSALASSDNLHLGARANKGNPWHGGIGEICMFNRVLTDDQVTDMYNYLTAKWSITLD